MSTDATIHVNTGTEDEAYGESGVEYTEVDVDNDFLVFSAGSDTVILSSRDGSVSGEQDILVSALWNARCRTQRLRFREIKHPLGAASGR